LLQCEVSAEHHNLRYIEDHPALDEENPCPEGVDTCEELQIEKNFFFANMRIRISVWESYQYESQYSLLRVDPKSFVHKIMPSILAEDTRDLQVYVSHV
jgi:hypothetical protein